MKGSLLSALLLFSAAFVGAQALKQQGPGLVPIANGGTGSTTAAGAVSGLGAASTSAANTLSGTQTITSSVTVSAAIGATGATNFSGVAFSSASIQNFTTTATAGYVCISGSTLTWSSNGNLARINFSGNARSDTLAAVINLMVLLDGVVVSPQVAGSRWAMVVHEPVAGDDNDVSFSFYIKPTSGTRQACLSVWTSAGTATINVTNQAGTGEFSVREF